MARPTENTLLCGTDQTVDTIAKKVGYTNAFALSVALKAGKRAKFGCAMVKGR
ncbi:hypothetical protein [Nonomuraea sp. NPDC003214]